MFEGLQPRYNKVLFLELQNCLRKTMKFLYNGESIGISCPFESIIFSLDK